VIDWENMDIVKQTEDLHALSQRSLSDSVMGIESSFDEQLGLAKDADSVRGLSSLALKLVDLLEEEEIVNMWRKAAVVSHLKHNWHLYQEHGAFDGDMSFSAWATRRWGDAWWAWWRAYRVWVMNEEHLAWIDAYSPEERVRVSYGKVSRLSLSLIRSLEQFACPECGEETNGPGTCDSCHIPTQQVNEHIASTLMDEDQPVANLNAAKSVSREEYYAGSDNPWAELVGQRVVLHRAKSVLQSVCTDCGEVQVYGGGVCSCGGVLQTREKASVPIIEVLDVEDDQIARDWQEKLLSLMRVKR